MKQYREFSSDDQKSWELSQRLERKRTWAMIAAGAMGVCLGNLTAKFLVRLFLH